MQTNKKTEGFIELHSGDSINVKLVKQFLVPPYKGMKVKLILNDDTATLIDYEKYQAIRNEFYFKKDVIVHLTKAEVWNQQ